MSSTVVPPSCAARFALAAHGTASKAGQIGALRDVKERLRVRWHSGTSLTLRDARSAKPGLRPFPGVPSSGPGSRDPSTPNARPPPTHPVTITFFTFLPPPPAGDRGHVDALDRKHHEGPARIRPVIRGSARGNAAGLLQSPGRRSVHDGTAFAPGLSKVPGSSASPFAGMPRRTGRCCRFATSR